jgi:hypothetical protein
MDDEQHQDDTEGDENFGTAPEEAAVPGTPPQPALMDDGNPHTYASLPQRLPQQGLRPRRHDAACRTAEADDKGGAAN